VWLKLSAAVLDASGSSGAHSVGYSARRVEVSVAERRRVVRVSRTGELHGACSDARMTHNRLWKAVVLGE
jgi:hypothetical protein